MVLCSTLHRLSNRQHNSPDVFFTDKQETLLSWQCYIKSFTITIVYKLREHSYHTSIFITKNHINFWWLRELQTFYRFYLIKSMPLSSVKTWHSVIKWISSSTFPDLHIRQHHDFAGMFLKRPISISNLWQLIRKFVKKIFLLLYPLYSYILNMVLYKACVWTMSCYSACQYGHFYSLIKSCTRVMRFKVIFYFQLS